MAFIIHYPDAAANLFGKRSEEPTLLAREIKTHTNTFMIIQEASDIAVLLAAFVLLVTLDFPFFVLNVNIYYLFSENFFLIFFYRFTFLSLSHTSMQTDTSSETYKRSKPIDSKGKEPLHQFIIVVFSLFFFCSTQSENLLPCIEVSGSPFTHDKNAYFLCANA